MKRVPLAEVADFNPRPNRKQIDPEQFVSFIGMADVSDTDQRIIQEEERPAHEVLKGYTYFERGDVLVAKITPCFENGKMTIADIEHPLGFGSTEFHVIRVDQDALDTRYLYHYLRRPALRAKGQVKMKGSAGQKRLPTFFLERLKIPLPPLDEQRHIAAVLDRADALRIKRRRAQAMLNDLLRSAFVEMFGESRATRVHFADVITNLRNGLSPASAGTFSGRVLTLDAVTGAGYNREAMKKAVFDREMPPDKLVDPRDFLICRGNGNIELVGRGAFPDREETDVLFPDTMIGARIDEGQILPEYLEMAWRTQDLRDQIERGARTTNGTHKINQKVLNAIELPLPTMEKQAKFAKIGSVRISVYGSGRG